VCSGLDLTKYLAYLSLCTISSHFPLFFHFLVRPDDLVLPARLFSTSTHWQGPLLATLISFELVRACVRHGYTLLWHKQMSRNEVLY
jgi:hypothetical protein